MADVLFVVITVVFFALAASFVQACERILGPDEAPPATASTAAPLDTVTATDGVDDRPKAAIR